MPTVFLQAPGADPKIGNLIPFQQFEERTVLREAFLEPIRSVIGS
jgi:hypothetical protein